MKQTLPIIVLSIALLPAMAPAQDPPAPEAPAPGARPEPPARQVGGDVPRAPRPSERRTYSFQISLLLADIQGGAGSEGLSKNAQKALEDLKEFLPFKSYRLLDFAWLRTSRHSSARVQGPGGKTYELSLRLGVTSGEDSGRLYISNFDLRDTSGVNLIVDEEDTRPLLPPQSLISTSFGMDEGETVVVGTSRLDGDQKALVVLLTAVPSSVGG